MILTGMAGKGSGKLGSQVYSSVMGQQVVRAYQPNVANPNTTLQVNVRARFKLMSQLSAVFAPILAYRRKGSTSARNLFVKRNFDATSGNDGQAIISLENIQITSGTAGLPGIHAVRDGLGNLTISLVADTGSTISRVVYVIFKKTGAAQLQLMNSVVVGYIGTPNRFPATIEDIEGDLVIYAYGMLDTDARATAAYGNYAVNSGEDIAHLVMSRMLSYNNYRFTRTRGIQLNANELEISSAGPNDVRVFLTPSGEGVVSGYGIYDKGEEVTIQAIPAEGSSFVGWLQNGTSNFVGYSPTLIFDAESLVDLVAVFYNPNSTTGGLNGEEMTNPLPYSQEVSIDGTNVDISLGFVDLDASFDEIEIPDEVDSHQIVFVPKGSSYGDADNIAFEWDDNVYSMSQTNTGSGVVYRDGLIWFYIDTEPWENPYPDAKLLVDGSLVAITSESVLLDAAPDFIYIQDIGADNVVTAAHEGEDVPFRKEGDDWRNDNTGPDMPLDIFVNGTLWITISAM